MEKTVIPSAAFLLTLCFLSGVEAFAVQNPETAEIRGYSLSTSYSVKNGLSQNSVTSIFQDSEGYMWLGTRDGLNRFDGYSFDVIDNDIASEGSKISNSYIFCIEEDGDGHIWAGTRDGLNRIDKINRKIVCYNDFGSGAERSVFVYSLCHTEYDNTLWIGADSGLYYYDPAEDIITEYVADGIFRDNEVSAIVPGGQNILYIGTRHSGLVRLDVGTGKYSVLRHLDASARDDDRAADIRSLLMDSSGRLWIGTFDSGLYFLDAGAEIPERWSGRYPGQSVRTMTEAPDGRIWVGTSNGIQIVEPASGGGGSINADKDLEDIPYGLHLSHHSVYALCFDRENTLWIGTYAGGVDLWNPALNRFVNYSPLLDMRNSSSAYGQAVEYGDCLYIGTQGDGLLEFNMKTGKVKLHRLIAGGHYDRNIIKYLYLHGGGIYCSSSFGHIFRFDPVSSSFEQVVSDGHAVLLDDVIYQIEVFDDGSILFGNVGHYGLSMVKKDGTIVHDFPVQGGETFRFRNVTCFLNIGNSTYLIGTRFDGIYRYDFANRNIFHYTNEDIAAQDYNGSVQINQIYADSQSRIWIATAGTGLKRLDPVSGTFVSYARPDGLLHNNVRSIVETPDGHLWLGTASGISDFDPLSESFRNYSYSDGIMTNEFSEQAALRTADGKLWFFGDNSFISFDPEQFLVNDKIPPIVIESIRTGGGRRKSPDTPDSMHPCPGQKIVLEHDESNLTIEYAALSYVASGKNTYAYRLKGFEDEWNDVGTRRTAYYTNIPPGEYEFEVRGANNDGVMNMQGTSVSIVIRPPLWQSWWAWVLYCMAFSAVAFLFVIWRRNSERLKEDIRLEQLKTKAQQEFNAERNKLFTNFSHELRSPLTLVMSPLDAMAEDSGIPERWKERVELMKNNCRRLLRLVNNLMYFTKHESGNLKIKVSAVDWIGFSREMHLLFSELAISRNIAFRFIPGTESAAGWLDRDFMEKVYFNLLSNAFKNTPDGGIVELAVRTADRQELEKQYHGHISTVADASRYIVVSVADSGDGIPDREYEKIFAPFYQVATNEHARSGTGLGLNLSRTIVQMHHGAIWAADSGLGGAMFSFVIPLDRENFASDEITDVPFDGSLGMDRGDVEIAEDDIATPVVVNSGRKEHTVMVVEDNADMRHYILSCVGQYYNTIECSNGKTGIEKAIHYLPDIILSDLMMPGMDGMEMCLKLKNDIRTSHIPVIMITAMTTVSDIESGYRNGADDYITKPFSPRLLLARISNILKQRDLLKEAYGKHFSLESLGVETSSLDERFMQKAYELLEANITNVDLTIDNFCKELGMSRSNVYRKINAITGLAPNEFIRNFRLEMAAKMLKESDMSVSDVYAAVGFNTHAHFSSCFRKKYGMSPSEYKKTAL